MKKVCVLIYVPIAIGMIASGCTTFRKSHKTTQKVYSQSDTLSKNETTSFHPTSTRTIDIIHTKLDVNFDWQKQHLNGKATITFKPYFYSVKEITLDAKSFEIKEVSLFTNPTKTLPFTYNKSQLTITLDKEYTRNDTLKIFIDYVAKPNEREAKTGSAITSDKGLYFINPLGKEKNKPTQIWTQGEPESNSCWFPTVDKPNERMTQEIFITLDSAHKHFSTLSNGLLISSKKNQDGSRTDHWKQSLPATPYLFMMAIGDYAIVKDKWKNLEVNYYVEHEYEPYAKNIFGNTPEMMEFFSNKLGVIYPWEKYSQVVVRDFVSGAMENNTASLYGEMLHQTDRELLDSDFEYIIAHELIHHWFGNYVTTESWANITLNEGFATYGEYLWKEYKYGRDNADHHARESMQGYLSSAVKEPKRLIRCHYNDPDEVFDSHSYNKGSAVLHMLRKQVGDDAFFSAIKLYLEQNKFSSVEAAHLRLAFEQVTGEDLRWFFDQWFFAKGHPKLLIQHNYNDTAKKYFVGIRQLQDVNTFPVFKIPVDIDFYMDGKKERKRVWVENGKEDFVFPFARKPDFVNVDAEKSLLCTKDEKLSVQERVFQYKNCPLYTDRLEALKECANFASIPEAADVIISALNDKNSDLRERAINMTEKLPAEYKSKVKDKLMELAKNDVKSSVRAMAIEQLANNYSDDDLTPLYLQSLNDKSYSVAGSSLSALAKKDEKEAMKIAKQFETDKSMDMLLVVAQIYSAYGNDQLNPFFVNLSQKMSGWENASFANIYTEFLKKCSDDTINAGIKILEHIARTEDNRWVSYFGQKGINDLSQMYVDREEKIIGQINKLKAEKGNPKDLQPLELQLAQAQNQKQKLTSLYNSVMAPN